MLGAIGMDGVVIAHQNNRSGVVSGAETLHHCQGLLDGLTRPQRPRGSGLNGRPVRHGIGKRHAKFDEVRACRRKLFQNFGRCFEIRIARRDERNKARALERVQLRETRRNAAHSFFPRALATVKTSLSPRPESPSTMILSADIFGAPRITCAIACEASSAGMMPSRRQVS